jgi:hypothetical protein
MSNDPGSALQVRVKPAKHHSRSPRKRRVLLRSIGVIAIFALLTMVASFAMTRLYQGTAHEAVRLTKFNDTGVGSVMVETNNQHCELLKFDNHTGRTVDNTKRCQNTVVLDANGVQVPLGTVHRLDSISKSFSGADR